MTWTYTGPANSDSDAVRFLIGDTLSTDPLLSNEEVAWLLSERGGVYPAAIQACETLAAKFARMTDTVVDDVEVKASQRAKQFRELRADLQRRAALSGGALPYLGGQSISDKQAREDDTDRVPPIFGRDMHVVSPSSPFSTREAS